VSGDRLVHAFSAFEPGSNQVTSIASIDGGARGTAQLAARPTGFENHVVGELVAREDDPSVISSEHVSTKADGMGAPPAARSLGQELGELMFTRMAPDGMEHGDVVFVQHGAHLDERS
jgi:hypothetical protein